jgi:translation initiation factor 4B
MVVDMATQKPKGYGYVEFEDRDGLFNALQMNGESLMNRNVRVNVAEGRKS